MKIAMEERRILIKHEAKRYQCSGKKEKTAILDRFVAATGYDRVYAARVLRTHGRCVGLKGAVLAQADGAGHVTGGVYKAPGTYSP